LNARQRFFLKLELKFVRLS